MRSGHEVMVRFNDHPHAIQKNQLFKVQSVIDVEDMHIQYDYNS